MALAFGLWSLVFDFFLRPKTKGQRPAMTKVKPTAARNSPASGRIITATPPITPARHHHNKAPVHFLFLFSSVSAVLDVFRIANVAASNSATNRKFVST